MLGLGAAEFIDYTQQDVAKSASDMDLAFDTVGGALTDALLATVRAAASSSRSRGPARAGAAERGVRAELLIMSPSADQLAKIADLVASGEVKVDIAQTLPLAEAARAHELSESGHTRGKIILTVDA